MVGRHAVLLKQYDDRLSASEIVFDRMEIWVRILNLPLGWMNQQRGSRAMSLIGHVVKMDVDKDGKASGAFLRGRVAIEVDKPLRRGVLLRMSKMEESRWFEAQYEKLPFYCFACGVLGHSEIECSHPVSRNDQGKLPYDVQLRAPEERRRRVQSGIGEQWGYYDRNPQKAKERQQPECKIGGGCTRQSPPGTMKILCLNCRGLGQPEAVRDLCSLCELHRPTLVFLSETRFFSDNVDRLRISLGFASGLGVGSFGRGGGLAFLWKEELDVRLLSLDKLHIDVAILDSITKEEKWRFIGFYGEPRRELRHRS
jgi:hypothetical protein